MIERIAARRLEHRRALFSACENYRYLLEVAWPTPPYPVFGPDVRAPAAAELLPFVGLNPSSATHLENDATLRRCIGFARALGYRGLRMLNLAAYRATMPREMLAAADPIGPEHTVEFLQAYTEEAPMVVLCWGTWGAHRELAARAHEVLELVGARGRAFGLTGNGQPLHPLYLPYHSALQPLAELAPGPADLSAQL